MSMLMAILMVMNCKASYQQERAQTLLYAKDSKIMKMKINSLSESEKLKTKCDYELSQNLVPASCYKLSLPKEKIVVIDQACERASIIMKEEVQVSRLSAKCKDFVSKKNKDLRYSKEEESPEEILNK